MYGFNVIEPIEVTDEVLTASTFIESAPEWNETETGYSLGSIVDHIGSIWEATDDVGTGKEPGVDDDAWIRLGANNTMAMFDEFISTQSAAENAGSAEITVPAGKRANCLYAENVDAVSATVTVSSDAEGVIRQETKSLVDLYSTSMWEWLYNPIRRRRFVLFEGFLANPGDRIEFSVETYGGTVAVGDCVVGRAVRIGTTAFGGELGFVDFSAKARDELSGGFEIVERAFARTGSFQVLCLAARRDAIWTALEEARASRRVFVASDATRATIINGLLTEARQVVSYPNHDLLNISAESLA